VFHCFVLKWTGVHKAGCRVQQFPPSTADTSHHSSHHTSHLVEVVRFSHHKPPEPALDAYCCLWDGWIGWVDGLDGVDG